MSFAEWKKQSWLFKQATKYRLKSEIIRMAQAAYKAGERQGRNDMKDIAKRAIILRDRVRDGSWLVRDPSDLDRAMKGE